jgi:hypothetical protein
VTGGEFARHPFMVNLGLLVVNDCPLPIAFPGRRLTFTSIPTWLQKATSYVEDQKLLERSVQESFTI